MSQSTREIIATVLTLPAEERIVVMDAIHSSLVDPQIDHGPEEDPDEVQAAWKDEIARRIDDIKNHRVRTVPAIEAEKMIRGDAKPTF